MSIFSFVKSKLSILDVILEYSQMKRMGGYWKGPCPFHQETDASFTVSPDKQIFYCFGCHAGGDVIAFVAKIENMSPYEAVCHLVEKYNLQVPEEIKGDLSAKGGNKKEQFFYACQGVAQWCHEQLLLHDVAKKYLEKRNIARPEWDRFCIGYFPGGIHFLNKMLRDLSKKNILVKDLVDIGFLAQGKSGLYSPFEERILFPIRDILGRYCGFGGRIFMEHDERAKYYNSKESEAFLKGKLLFGLDLAKKEIQATGKAFLVEGYTDCVAMVQHGHKATVATLGTACTADHLKMISRYGNRLYVVYDGDRAGQNAILRLTKLCWEANLDLQIISLPAAHDPASFLESGGDVKELVAQTSDIFTFFVNSLGEQFWGKPLSEKIELCDKIIEVIARISDKFKKDILLQQAASVMQVSFDTLKSLADKKAGESVDMEDRVVQEEEAVSTIEEHITALVINSVMSQSPLTVQSDLLPYFSSPIKRVLGKVDAFINEYPEKRDFEIFLGRFETKEERDWVLRQSFMVEDETPESAFERLQFRFRKKNWKRIVSDIKKQIFQAKQENDKVKLQGLLVSFLSLKQEMKQRGLI